MKILKKGDPKKAAKALASNSWIGEKLTCKICKCAFVLSTQDRDKVHLEMGDCDDDGYDYGYFVSCPQCLSDVLVRYCGDGNDGDCTSLADTCNSIKCEQSERGEEARLRKYALEYLPVLRELERAHRVRDVVDVRKDIRLSSRKSVQVRIWTKAGHLSENFRSRFALKNHHKVTGEISDSTDGNMLIKIGDLSGILYEHNFRRLDSKFGANSFYLEKT